MAGDWNFVEAAEDTTFTYNPLQEQNNVDWHDLIRKHSLRELYQPIHTYQRAILADGATTPTRDSSRLDRIYANIPESCYLLHEPQVTVKVPRLFSKPDARFNLHIPLMLTFRKRTPDARENTRVKKPPKWVYKHPLFKTHFIKRWLAVRPHARTLVKFKETARCAGKDILFSNFRTTDKLATQQFAAHLIRYLDANRDSVNWSHVAKFTSRCDRIARAIDDQDISSCITKLEQLYDRMLAESFGEPFCEDILGTDALRI